MQKAVNFLRGSVRLEVSGPYPERFFNICAAENLGFWAVQRVDGTTVRLTVPRRERKRAAALGRRCMSEVRPVRERGLPEFLLRFRRRYGMLAGLFLALMAAVVLSRFVLVVEVTGNETVPTAAILAELREAGFGVGSYGPRVDERAVSNRVLLRMEELGFLSINLHGVRAQVVVREAARAPEVADPGAAADIVAARDGYVLDVDALAGEARVQPGQAVLAGEVLISGLVTCESGDGSGNIASSYQVAAKGRVWAQTRRTYTARTPLTAWGKAYTGRERTRWSLRILDQCVKISAKAFQPFENYDTIIEVSSLTLKSGLTLPVALVKTVCAEYVPEARAVTEESAEAYLRAELTRRLNEALGDGGEVLDLTWSADRTGDALTVTVEAVCREEIGRTVPLSPAAGPED